MADYKTIHGISIRDYTTDPDTLITGQVWFDTTNKVLQFQAAAAGAWASGGNMNTARRMLGSAGTRDSALGFGGVDPGRRAENESYNGTAWTELADLNVGRRDTRGCGASNTSAICFGGGSDASPSTTTITEKWDGSSWTEVADLNTGRAYHGSAGINTAALAFGGTGGNSAVTESWNDSSWTEVNDLNTARHNMAGSGLYTAALSSGGESPRTGKTESWNGTSWTEVADLNTARRSVAGAGTNTATIIFGGYNATDYVANTESWNGTAWTEVADLSAARTGLGGSGATSGSTASLAFAGEVPPPSAVSEEWSDPSFATKTADTD